MKKALFILAVLVNSTLSAKAQDFSAVPFNGNGYEIYYTILDANHVAVTRPAPNQPYVIVDTVVDEWHRCLEFIIPDSVMHGGHSYCVSAIADSAFANVGNAWFGNIYDAYNVASLEISLPATINTIGRYAFANDTASVYIYMRGATPPAIDATSFTINTTYGYGTIAVPCGSETNYTNAWCMGLFDWSYSLEGMYIYPLSTVYFNDITTRDKGYINFRYATSSVWEEGREISFITIPCAATTVTMWATPDSGFHFSHWSNGSTQDTITVNLPYTGLLYAYFESNGVYTVDAVSADTTRGYTIGGGQFHYGDTAVLTAIASEHYHFSHWNDGNTDNPRYYIVQFQNETITAFFVPDSYTVTATTNDITAGNVFGGGQFEYGVPCTLEATAYSGYHFAQWSNGTTYNPYTFAVVEDVNLTAIFLADGEEGIADVVNDGMRVVVRDGKITVEGANGESVFIYGTEGRLVSNNMLQTGTYFVKIGNHPACKVVLIK